MKRILLAGIGLVALAASASAADLARRAPPAPAPAPVVAPFYTWTGFYIGGHIGWGSAELESTVVEPFGPFVAGTTFGGKGADGFLGGVQAGFNWQAGVWVFGVEAQVSWSDIGRDRVITGPAGNTLAHSTSIDMLGSLAGRLGVAFGNALIYAKGGGAFLDWSSDVAFAGPTVPGVGTVSFGDTEWGWMVGAGVEWGFIPNWSAKIEYNFMSFDLDEHRFTLGGVGSRFDHELDVHVVKLGINYRFGWDPAPGYPAARRY
jgi:outer membrane immunogenic protein